MRVTSEKEKKKAKECLDRIEFLLKETGVSKNKLADIVGVDHSVVYMWFYYVSFPKAYYLLRIANFFDVTLDWLMDGKKESLSKKYVLEEIEKFKKEINERY